MHDSATGPYEKLVERFQEIALINGASALLGWDQETYMPARAVDTRAKQQAYFSGRVHALATDSQIGDLIAECEAAGSEGRSALEAANLREWRRSYDREVKLPSALVEELAETSSRSVAAWQEARAASDFSSFAPQLEKLMELARRKADAVGYEADPYDALVDDYEQGVTGADIEATFEKLEPELVEIVAEACERPCEVVLPEGPYPIAAQQAFNQEVAEAIGFDFEGGRIDTAAHPFCSGLTPGDVRLTTRYMESDFTSSLFGVLHEAGHGLYEQGLPAEQFGLPGGASVSLGIHESQSRLWENHVGRSRAFWNIWFPRAQAHFPQLSTLSLDDMVKLVNRAQRSHIRVEADEVTYDLHILLRFQLERALISGDLPVRDLPGEWNSRFEKMFGLPVTDDAQGCLQDIHWSFGLVGYFPTYTLGNLNAAQLFRAARQQNPGIDGELADGKYESLLGWLRQNVHELGMQKLPPDLMQAATGESTQHAYHLAHLRDRYLG